MHVILDHERTQDTILEFEEHIIAQRIFRRRENNILRFQIIDQVVEVWIVIIDTAHRYKGIISCVACKIF